MDQVLTVQQRLTDRQAARKIVEKWLVEDNEWNMASAEENAKLMELDWFLEAARAEMEFLEKRLLVQAP